MLLNQPETKEKEIIEGFNAEASREAGFRNENDIGFIRLLHEINKLKKANAFLGWQLHGALQAFTGNVEEFRRCIENAKRLGDMYSQETIGIYFPTLIHLGLTAECQSELRKVDWARLGLVSEVGAAAFMSGSVRFLSEMYKQADAISLKYEPIMHSDELSGMLAIMDEEGLNDDDIAFLMDSAFHLMKERRLISSDIFLELLTDGLERDIVVRIGLAASLEALDDLQYEFSLTMAKVERVFPRVHVIFDFADDVQRVVCQ